MNIRFQPADGSIHFYTGLHVNPWKIPSLEHPTLPNKDLELHFVQIFWSQGSRKHHCFVKLIHEVLRKPAVRLEAIASRLEAIAIRLEAWFNVLGLEVRISDSQKWHWDVSCCSIIIRSGL